MERSTPPNHKSGFYISEPSMGTLNCLYFPKDAALLDQLSQAEPGPEEVVYHHAESKAQVLSLAQTLRNAFALVRPSATFRERGFSERFMVRSFISVPAVAVVDRPVPPEMQEQLRQQGISGFLKYPVSREQLGKLLQGLAKVSSWQQGMMDEQLGFVPLLGRLMAQKRSCVLLVSCPHQRHLEERLWSEATPTCSGMQGIQCDGWWGRVYLKDGVVLYVETPAAIGEEAFLQLRTLRHGTQWVQDFFVGPLRVEPEGRLQQRLLSKSPELMAAQAAPIPPELNRAAHEATPARSFPAQAPQSVQPASRATPVASPTPMWVPPSQLPDMPKSMLESAPATLVVPRASTSDHPTLPKETPSSHPHPTADKGPEPKSDGVKAAQLLGLAPGIKAAIRADSSGNVLELAGQADAESLCAVLMMTRPRLEQISSLLGMGELQAFSLTNSEASIFVQTTPQNQTVVLTGETSKSPENVMRKLAQALGEPV